MQPAYEGDTVYLLRPVSGVSELFRVDGANALSRVVAPASGGDTEASLTIEEKLRRERTRTQTVGITSFVAVPGGRGALFPQGGHLFWAPPGASGAAPVVVVDRAGGPAGGPVLDARPSPDGKLIAFVQDDELWVAPLEAGGGARRTRVSPGGGGGTVTHGVADYLAAEEFDRHEGFWWSPDSGALAYQRTDDGRVPLLTIVHAGAEPAAATAAEAHRYPFAGAANPVVQLGVVDVRAAVGAAAATAAVHTRWLDLGANDDVYVARVQWVDAGAAACDGAAGAPWARLLAVQLLNRAQSVLDVALFNCDGAPTPHAAAPGEGPAGRAVATVPGMLLLREATDDDAMGWLNVHDCLTFLPPASLTPSLAATAASVGGAAPAAQVRRHLLWASERTGFQHLYLYDFDAGAAAAGSGGYAGPPASAAAAAAAAANGRSPPPAARLLGAVTCDGTQAPADPAPAPASSASSPSPPNAGAATHGWLVETVAGVAPVVAPVAAAPAFVVFFTGTCDGPLERHMYATLLTLPPHGAAAASGDSDGAAPPCLGGAPVRVTTGAGMHTVVMAPSCRSFVDSLSSLGGPASTAVYALAVSAGGAVPVAKAPRPSPSSSPQPPTVAAAGAPASRTTQSPSPSPPPPSASKDSDELGVGVVTGVSVADFVSGLSLVAAAAVRFDGAGGAGGRYGSAMHAALPQAGADGHVHADGVPTVSASLLCVAHGVLPPQTPTGAPVGYGGQLDALREATAAAAAAAAAAHVVPPSAVSVAASAAASAALGVAAAARQRFGSWAMGGGGSGDKDSASPPFAAPPAVSGGGGGGGGGGSGGTGSAKDAADGAAASPPTDAAAVTATAALEGAGALFFRGLSSLATAGSTLSAATGQAVTSLATAGTDAAREVGGALTDAVGAVTGHAATAMEAAVLGSLAMLPGGGASADGDSAAAPSLPPAASAVGDIERIATPPPLPAVLARALEQHTPSPPPATRPPPPLIVRVPAADGSPGRPATQLYGVLHLPDVATHGRGPYPTIISVYGGPHVQRVKHDYATASEARALALCRAGYLVAAFDNRGGARRGVAFERALSRRMGSVEVDDQAGAVAWLVRCGLADPARVGVYGWSYGGYMALLCAAKRGDVFAAAVAGAPVTDWAGYDTAYTERYMGTPAGNPGGYADASVLRHVGGLAAAGERVGGAPPGAPPSPPPPSRLLLVHGLVDENVHARHTWRLITGLIAAGVRFDLLPLPVDRHLPRDPAARAYVEARIAEFFAAALQPRPQQQQLLQAAAAPTAGARRAGGRG